jgi:hypothetical protein
MIMEGKTNPPELVGTESTIKTDSSKYNASTRIAQQYHEERNTVENWHTIISAIKSGRARDISDEPKAPIHSDNHEKMPCIIIGSGPSLDDSIDYLKQWKGGIICTTSHALTLMHHGIEPTHIMALDAFSLWDEIKGVDWSKTRTKLICHPGVWPTLIENWPNEMLLYIENLGNPNSFYATTQKRMYSHREGPDLRAPTFHFYIRTEITLFACSPPIQLFAAEVLGYGTIFTAGVDFGFSAIKNRFTSWDFDWDKWPYDKLENEARQIKEEIENGLEKDHLVFWEKFRQTFQDKEPKKLEWRENIHLFVKNEKSIVANNGLYTEDIHIYYKKNFLSSWFLSGKTMYSTDHGIVTEIPYSDIKAVIKKQGYGYKQQSKAFISEATEPYLALVSAFVIETDHGYSFVEAQNPAIDLPKFMAEIRKRYICLNCNIKLMADNDIDRTDMECPQCKQGKLKREVNVDIDKNMERINHYLEKAKHINIVKS